jgi:hypothetical protein
MLLLLFFGPLDFFLRTRVYVKIIAQDTRHWFLGSVVEQQHSQQKRWIADAKAKPL